MAVGWFDNLWYVLVVSELNIGTQPLLEPNERLGGGLQTCDKHFACGGNLNLLHVLVHSLLVVWSRQFDSGSRHWINTSARTFKTWLGTLGSNLSGRIAVTILSTVAVRMPTPMGRFGAKLQIRSPMAELHLRVPLIC